MPGSKLSPKANSQLKAPNASFSTRFTFKVLGEGAYGVVLAVTAIQGTTKVSLAFKVGEEDDIVKERQIAHSLLSKVPESKRKFFIRQHLSESQTRVLNYVKNLVKNDGADLFVQIRDKFNGEPIDVHGMEILGDDWITVNDMISDWNTQSDPPKSLIYAVGQMMRNARLAFETMWKAGFIHADAHSGNVMVNRKTGSVKIIDYGLMASVQSPLPPRVYLSNPTGLEKARIWFHKVSATGNLGKRRAWWSNFTWANHASFHPSTGTGMSAFLAEFQDNRKEVVMNGLRKRPRY